MRQLSFLGPFLLLAFPSACGSSASDDSLGNGGSAGSAGSAGAGAAAGAGATAGAGGTAGGETTYEALNVCGQAPSYPATASFDDGSGATCSDVFDKKFVDTYPEGSGLYISAAVTSSGLGLVFYDRIHQRWRP